MLRSAAREPLFQGVVLAGFECSEHRRRDGRRLDLLESTRHDVFVEQDYQRLHSVGISACREGVSWVRSEPSPGRYDFQTAGTLLRAARAGNIEVVWDLMHFGWPDDVDVFAADFPTRFGRYAGAFARWYAQQTDARLCVAPINEMSFLAWAGGDVHFMNPHEAARGTELKAQLVLATIEAIEAIRVVIPNARFLSPEPVIHIGKSGTHPRTWARADSDQLLQFQAWDMLSGRVWPRLGGHPRYLDILGLNFYPDNQFIWSDGSVIERGQPDYQPFSRLVEQVYSRYQRPLIVSETGCEGALRPAWFRYVLEECCTALRAGCELHGITLYPILNHPGWDDDRHCENGLWDYADAAGRRAVYEPLAEEIRALSGLLTEARANMLAPRSSAPSQPSTAAEVMEHA